MSKYQLDSSSNKAPNCRTREKTPHPMKQGGGRDMCPTCNRPWDQPLKLLGSEKHEKMEARGEKIDRERENTSTDQKQQQGKGKSESSKDGERDTLGQEKSDHKHPHYLKRSTSQSKNLHALKKPGDEKVKPDQNQRYPQTRRIMQRKRLEKLSFEVIELRVTKEVIPYMTPFLKTNH